MVLSQRLSVCVVVPTYNRASLVVEAIDSLLAQTRVPDEIVVVDDGSTDDTKERLRTYAAPVHIIWQPHRGRSEARNAGVQHSQADTVCFLDSDDLLPSKSIESRVSWLEDHPDDMVVLGYTKRVDMPGNPVSEQDTWWPPPRELFFSLAKYNMIPNCSYMVRRKHLPAYPYFDQAFEPLEDWGFIVCVAAYSPRFHVLAEMVGLYRHHEDMTVFPGSQFIEPTIRVQEHIYRMEAFRALTSSQQASIFCSHALTRMEAGAMESARLCLQRGIRIAPWYVATYWLWALSWFGAPFIHTRVRQVLSLVRRITR